MPNSRVRNMNTITLSDNWYTLKKVTYDYLKKNREWETQSREVYDRGNGATILLYNRENKTVILTRQFRMPAFLNGDDTGMLIECCAGLLDKENAEECIRREAEEETGYLLSSVEKIFEVYMSPGSVTEILHFFIAEYTSSMKMTDGGGVNEEQEEIEVLEVKADQAYQMISTGQIRDAKTIMLLQHLRLKGILEGEI